MSIPFLSSFTGVGFLVSGTINGTVLGGTVPAAATVTSLSATGNATFSGVGKASSSTLAVTGSPYSAGTATTNLPLVYLNTQGSAAPTTLSTAGTFFGVNAPSGFGGNFVDMHANGAASVFSVDFLGAVNCTLVNCAQTVTATSGFYSAGSSLFGQIRVGTGQITTSQTLAITANQTAWDIDATAGPVTITLPAYGGAYQGALICLKKIDTSSNVVTIAGNIFNIDGVNNILLTVPNQSLVLKFGWPKWVVSASHTPYTSTSTGTPSAGRVVALNASGTVDATMIPGGIGTLVATIPATLSNSSSGVTYVLYTTPTAGYYRVIGSLVINTAGVGSGISAQCSVLWTSDGSQLSADTGVQCPLNQQGANNAGISISKSIPQEISIYVDAQTLIFGRITFSGTPSTAPNLRFGWKVFYDGP